MSQVQTNFTAADMLGGANKAVPAKRVAPKPAPKVEAPVVVEEVAPVAEEVAPVEEESAPIED
jgi:hypothetical protein